MPHYNSFNMDFSKLRNACGIVLLHWRRYRRILWLIAKNFMRLRGLVSLFDSGPLGRPLSPKGTHTFCAMSSSAVLTEPQNDVLFSSGSKSLKPLHAEFEPCHLSASGSNVTEPIPIEEPYDYGQPPLTPSSPSSSQTLDGEATFGMEGADTLQPMCIPNQLEPTRPEDLLRYAPKDPVSMDRAIYTVEALQTDFCPKLPGHLSSEWVRLEHFEGQPFFYHEEKKIITDAGISNPDVWTEIASFIEMIESYVKANRIRIPQNSELVIELRSPEGAMPGEYCCGYYYAHHETRSIFWLQDFCLDPYLVNVLGGQLASEHIKLHLEFQYWKHIELFETIQVIPSTVLNELMQIIMNGWSDVITSNLSTVNHSEKELGTMLKLVEKANNANRGCPLLVGKFMSQFLHERFLNYHGQEAARLTRHQSIYGEPSSQDKRSRLMSIISPILFYAPNDHLRNLGKIWVDKIAAKQEWIKLISKSTSEWAEHTAFATILLNANVAFLDIPSVESMGTSQSLSQIFSYISIVLVIGSAILGLLLVRQHRTKHIGTAKEAAKFLSAHSLEATAIVYSLPYALLMYGSVLFHQE
ncbi:hypothetical protein FB451DRAFT_1211066 [Mycena latifolia]|nr:hypothetical protein FB451DRAFT_1211066 [Mycena latifolia]